ncbi:hypothetical protein IU486_11075 [Streptomyces gardneri]|nr:hypothetical protein [Streptomyces gardneri]
MSESNGEGHRSRRRAVRSAGPPVEENATPTGAKTAAPEVPAARETAPAADSGTSSVAAESDLSAAPAAPAPATGDADTSVALAKTDAQSSPEATPTEQKTAPSKGRNLPRVLATAAAALLVIALVCGAALSVLAMRSAHERDERRAEYVETARQAVVNLTTIRADSAKQDIDRILSLASGEFKTEFDGRVDPFTSIVQQAKVVSSGEIVEAALESDDDRSGRVLVAAKQTLTNAGQAEPQTRYYRFRVTVSRGDTGLTVSDVEFVA